MGNDASVPRNDGVDGTTPTNHQAPPQGGRGSGGLANNPEGVADANNAVGNRFVSPTTTTATTSVGLRNNPPGIIPYQQPQSQQQHQIMIAGTSPPNNHPQQQHAASQQQQQQQQGGGSSSTSIMSRAGLSNMISRMGGSSRGGMAGAGGSGQVERKSGKQAANQNNHQHFFPATSPTTINSNNSNGGVHSPTRNSHVHSIHHQDLSPESKARRQAVMLKRQQEQQQNNRQQQQQKSPPSTQQSSSSYHTATSGNSSSDTLVNVMYTNEAHKSTTASANTAQTSNTSVSGNIGSPSSPIVQGMNNLSLSSGQQKQPPEPRSPPSPRAQSLKKMQNNDEEDWEKAWAEDSESDEDEEVAGSTQGEAGSTTRLPIVPSLEPLGDGRGKPAAAPIPYRPDIDGGHSSASVQVVAPPTSAMHSAFTPAKPQQPQPNSQQYYQQQQQQQKHTISTPTPIVQYPPIQPKSHFLSPEFPTNQREIEEDALLVREADAALRGEDGREDWDSYARETEEGEEVERPCVDMFDPALRVLGRGSFGRVVLVQKRHGQGSGTLYAMKILRKSHLVRRRQIERTKTERKVLSVLDHPFIMKMYYAFQTPEKLFLVLDYCPGGELFFHLSRYRRFQEPVSRFYAAELLLAIGHLHKNGIIYRDLKPENVLLDAYGHVKLGDFGLAKDGIRHPTQGAKSTCGTPEYMAPEVLNQGGHGFCVDYWGLGMILYEMMTGLPPWYTTDRSKLFRRLRSAPLVFPKEIHFSPHCKACIAGLLDREPRMRLGVMGLRSAMRHEFFYRRINFEALRARQIAAPIRPCEGWREFQSRSNSAVSNSGSEQFASPHGDGGWHSAGPSLDREAMGGISAEALDVATANFDDSFRRMPIETEDYETQQQAAGHAPISEQELNAQTFRGFTFDGDLPPEYNHDQTHYQHPPGRPSPGQHGSGGGVV